LEELRFLVSRGKLGPDVQVRSGPDGAWANASGVHELFPAEPDASELGPAMLTSSGVLEPKSEEPRKQQKEKSEASVATQTTNSIGHVPATPATVVRENRDPDETRQRMLIASSILAGILLLLLLLLLLFRLDRNGGRQDTLADRGISDPQSEGIDSGGGVGEGSSDGAGGLNAGSGDGNGSGVGSGDIEGSGGGDGNAEDTSEGPDQQGDDLGHASELTEEPPAEKASGDRPPEDDPLPSTMFRIKRIESTPLAEASGDGKGEGEGEDGGRHGEKKSGTIGGVKLKGKIALVCDVSGSMSSDFPVLVRELRSNFPKDTPLLLVNGCSFSPPNPAAPVPTKLAEMPAGFPGGVRGRFPGVFPGGSNVLGVDFEGDQHVYNASSTTDAIIFAVRELGRETVMFNSDLQDGGSLRAVEAFEELHLKRKFVLSGRSLNCDAPVSLAGFIKASGGEFKLDPIGRSPLPAVRWR
jgi:hypothetical protein